MMLSPGLTWPPLPFATIVGASPCSGSIECRNRPRNDAATERAGRPERAGEVDRRLAVVCVERAVRDPRAAVDVDRALGAERLRGCVPGELTARRCVVPQHRLASDVGRRRRPVRAARDRPDRRAEARGDRHHLVVDPDLGLRERETRRRGDHDRGLACRDRRRQARWRRRSDTADVRGRGSEVEHSAGCCRDSGSCCRTSALSRPTSCNSGKARESCSSTSRCNRPSAAGWSARLWFTPTVVPPASLLKMCLMSWSPLQARRRAPPRKDRRPRYRSRRGLLRPRFRSHVVLDRRFRPRSGRLCEPSGSGKGCPRRTSGGARRCC